MKIGKSKMATDAELYDQYLKEKYEAEKSRQASQGKSPGSPTDPAAQPDYIGDFTKSIGQGFKNLGNSINSANDISGQIMTDPIGTAKSAANGVGDFLQKPLVDQIDTVGNAASSIVPGGNTAYHALKQLTGGEPMQSGPQLTDNLVKEYGQAVAPGALALGAYGVNRGITNTVGNSPQTTAQGLTATANGMSKPGLRESIKFGSTFTPSGWSTGLIDSYNEAAADGVFESDPTRAKLTSAEKVASLQGVQANLEQGTTQIANLADQRLGAVSPSYTLTEKAISDPDVFSDPDTRVAASNWLDKMKTDYSKTTNSVADMLERKRALYSELSYNTPETAPDPAWMKQMKMRLASDLKNTTEDLSNRAVPGMGDQLGQINNKWGSYQDIIGDLKKGLPDQVGRIPLDDLAKPNMSSFAGIANLLGKIVPSDSIRKGFAWAYNLAPEGGIPTVLAPDAAFTAMKTLMAGTGVDPNMTPPAPQAPRGVNNKDIAGSKAQANIVANASAQGVLPTWQGTPSDYMALPTPLQEQLLQQVAPTMPRAFEPGVKGYRTAFRAQDGSWRVPLGSMDQGLELGQLMESKDPAKRASTVGPLLSQGVIITPSEGQNKIEEKNPASKSNPLAFLQGSQKALPPKPIAQSGNSDTMSMLEKMQQARDAHGQ